MGHFSAINPLLPDQLSAIINTYIERSEHIAVDGIWSVMIDAMLDERN